jgi:hypothetical protein
LLSAFVTSRPLITCKRWACHIRQGWQLLLVRPRASRCVSCSSCCWCACSLSGAPVKSLACVGQHCASGYSRSAATLRVPCINMLLPLLPPKWMCIGCQVRDQPARASFS